MADAYEIVAGITDSPIHHVSDDDMVGLWPFDGSNIADSPVVKSVSSAVKTIAKSGITKTIAGGLAVVFPPVGVPLAAGVAAANVAYDLADKGYHMADAAVKAGKGALAAAQGAPAVTPTHLMVLADRTLDVAAGTRGTPAQQAAMVQALKRTTLAAKAGDQAALHTIGYLAAAKNIREAHHAAVARASKAPTTSKVVEGRLVTGGKVVRGHWQRIS